MCVRGESAGQGGVLLAMSSCVYNKTTHSHAQPADAGLREAGRDPHALTQTLPSNGLDW